ncbi:MAG: tetratricopeptide repeat protein [Myxococcales bacterium]|nr:tetratricopeptide repeat protein [Myxococcales bacterium]
MGCRPDLGLFVLALAIGLVAPDTGALAQTTREPPPEAIELFASGRAHYEGGRYGDAARDLEAALQLDPGSPTLIYNLTRVYELMGDLDRALRYGEQYLMLLPPDDEEEREVAEVTLRRLRGARDYLALRQAAEQGQVQSLRQLAPRVIVRERGVADTPFWITLAAGAAVLAAGAVVGGLALKTGNDASDFVLRDPADQAIRQRRVDRADRLALSADILLGVGAVTCIAAGLLYLLRVRTIERDATPDEVALSIGSDGRGAWLVVRGAL